LVDVYNLPPNTAFDPNLMDMNLFGIGIPLWMYLMLALLFIGIAMLVVIVIYWFIMRPVASAGSVGDTSTAKGSPTQVYSIWKNRSFVIDRMWYYGNILAYSNPLQQMQMWIHNSEKATGVAAGKPLMITRDGFNVVVDLIAEMAMCEIPEMFHRDFGWEIVQEMDLDGTPVVDADGQPIMVRRERLDANGKPVALTSFSAIYRALPFLEKNYPAGVPIPIYQPYDLSRIYRFTPQNEDSLKLGVDLVEEAKEWARDEMGRPIGAQPQRDELVIGGRLAADHSSRRGREHVGHAVPSIADNPTCQRFRMAVFRQI
jgi:hypothetical protein